MSHTRVHKILRHVVYTRNNIKHEIIEWVLQAIDSISRWKYCNLEIENWCRFIKWGGSVTFIVFTHTYGSRGAVLRRNNDMQNKTGPRLNGSRLLLAKIIEQTTK